MGVVIYMLIQLEGLIKTIGILDVFDILIVAFILYRVYKMLENTRAITLTRGLLILLLLAIITKDCYFVICSIANCISTRIATCFRAYR